MNTAVALLSLLRLGHFPFLRPRLLSRTPASPHIAASMQFQRNVGLFVTPLPLLPSCSQPKTPPMWRNVEELISPLPLHVLPQSMTSFFAM